MVFYHLDLFQNLVWALVGDLLILFLVQVHFQFQFQVFVIDHFLLQLVEILLLLLFQAKNRTKNYTRYIFGKFLEYFRSKFLNFRRLIFEIKKIKGSGFGGLRNFLMNEKLPQAVIGLTVDDG